MTDLTIASTATATEHGPCPTCGHEPPSRLLQAGWLVVKGLAIWGWFDLTDRFLF